MAAKVWYGLASLASVHLAMSETSPGADATASPVTGWVVGTGATNHAEMFAQVERAATTFTGTTVPDGTPDTVNGDCFRSENVVSGSFAAANWTVQTAWIAVTNGGAQDGRMRCRLVRSANADGSASTEITTAQQQGGLVTNLATSAQQLSTATFNPGAFSVTNEYIFIQIAWERTGAGGMTTSDVNLRVGSTATVITSADFTAAADPKTATPATAALTTTTFAPTVTATDHQTVTPGVASLSLATFAPSVTVGVNVVPTTTSLSLATFAPTVSTTDHQTVTPGLAALTTTTFAPSVTASDHKTVVPGVATLTTATFAPTVTASDHQLVTPGVATLSLTTFAPTVTGGAGLTVVPDVAALSLTAFAPTITATDHKTVTPTTAALSLTALAPNVVATDHKTATPTTAALLLATFAPTVTTTAQSTAGGSPPPLPGFLSTGPPSTTGYHV